jgi:periplasmic divalent cation tolerance protein
MTRKDTYIVIYTTFPDFTIAKKIISGLVRHKYAACGNLFKLHSIYRWKNKIEREPEYGVFIKTRKNLYTKVETYIQKHHPYHVPEIVSWKIERGLAQYLQWIDETTANTRQ